MKKRPLLFTKSSDALPVADLDVLVSDWLYNCDYENVSETTLAKYRIIAKNFLWWHS